MQPMYRRREEEEKKKNNNRARSVSDSLSFSDALNQG